MATQLTRELQPDCCSIVEWALSGQYDPTKPVLIDTCESDPPRSISKNKAIELIASLAGVFEKNTTVCLHLANDILYPVLVLAIYGSSCRWTGTNTAYTIPELAHHIRVSDTKYVITNEEHLKTVRAAAGSAEIILFTDILFERRGGSSTSPQEFRTLHDLQRKSSVESLYATIRDIDLQSVSTLASTSGTTGRPKMAARTQRAMVLESAAIEEHPKSYQVRRLYCTPIFHGLSAPEMVGHFPSSSRLLIDALDHQCSSTRRSIVFHETLLRCPISSKDPGVRYYRDFRSATNDGQAYKQHT